jgi:hypothetical protein
MTNRRLPIFLLLLGLCWLATAPVPRAAAQPGTSVEQPPPTAPTGDRWEPLLPRSVLLGTGAPSPSDDLLADRSPTHEPWGLLPSQRVLRDLHVDPETSIGNGSQLERKLELPVSETVFLFGQVGSETEADSQTKKLASRSGLGCKLPLPAIGEVLLRTGPNVTWPGPHHTDQPQDHSPLFVELEGHLPLLGVAGLEYVGSAFPALSTSERDRLQQDVRLVVPLTPDWQFRIGAKHTWESMPESQPATTSLQLYLGTGIKW